MKKQTNETRRIKLGDNVKCKITGFKGIVVARTEFINGCVQYNVSPKWDKQKNPVEQEVSVDETSLEVIKKKVKKIKENDTGGAMKRGYNMKGY